MTLSRSHRFAALLAFPALSLSGCEDAKGQDATPFLDVLQVLPASGTLDVGETAQMGALRLRGGATTNVTGDVSWESDDESILTVSYDPVQGAVALALGPGTAHVTASDGDASARAEFVVRANVTSIELDKGLFELPKGTAAELGVTMITGIGEKRELDGAIAWGSSDPGVATVDADGVVTAVDVGDAVITLTREGATATQVVHVRDWALQSIDAVAVPAAMLPFGQSSTVRVTGNFSDDHTADISSLFEIASDEDLVALAASSMDPLVTVEGGTITAGMRAGTLMVSGRGRAGSIVDGQTFTLEISVIDAPLTALTLAIPPALSLGGDPAIASITGTYGEDLEFATTAMLSATPDGLVIVDNANASLLPLAAGTATITATVVLEGDEEGTAGPTIETSEDILVVEEGVTALTIELASSENDAAITVDSTISLSAAASFGAAGPVDVTELSVWTSSDESVAVVSNVSSGTVTGTGVGTATLSASYRGQAADFIVTVTE
jgi:uncharacterized protein YjdB